MKLVSLLFGLSLFSTSVFSHPLDLPFELSEDELQTLERRAPSQINVRGAAGGTQTRLEIRQMQSEQPDQFALLILAMKKFQARSQSASTSYYQIAGIHGVPRQDYNGVGRCSTCTGNNIDGYCTHDSVLFPAWHRAYMALFEQEFVQIAKQIANTWTGSNKAQMQSAAANIRFPYWDWAAIPPNNGPSFPTAVSSASITINGPNGQETIANPLYSYHFSSTAGEVYSPFINWPNTLRYPTTDAASATSQDNLATNAFNNIRGSLQDQVYKLMTSCTDYLHFSNDHAGSTASCSNSLEGIHNTIHTTSGGVPSSSVPQAGHMYYLSNAAFDPLFWLHHCNVDRLFALWQTLHPSSYGANQAMFHTTWTIPAGQVQTPQSPLTPFYRSGSTFWTTETIKDWTVFHYTYPEFADSDGSQASISKYVNNLYGPGATATAGSSKRSIFNFPQGALASNGSAFEYVANIVAPRYALNGTYIILLFLGAPASEDVTTWMTDSNLVGPMGVLSQQDMTEKDVPIAGQIPLTRMLNQKLGSGVVSELTEALVGPLLQNLLEWRIIGPQGQSVDPTTVPGFLVSVFSSTATNPESETELPQYSEFIPMPIATHGKKGGLPALNGSSVVPGGIDGL